MDSERAGAGLRIGVVGPGMIGRVHLGAARAAGAEVVALAASTAARAAAAASELGIPRAFAGAEELVVDDSIDVVHVCTPNRLHAPLAIRALEAGKDVICEKPMALAFVEAEEVATVAARTERILAVPFVYRYYPTVREARDRIRSGRLGEVKLILGSYLQDWLASPTDDNWRTRARDGGASRAFADIGSHCCDLIEFVTGSRLTELTALTRTAVPERGEGAQREAVDTEDLALVQFQTDAGAVGSVAVSQISFGAKNRLELRVDGSAGSLAFNQERPDTLWLGHGDGSVELLERDPRALGAAAAPYALLPPGHPQGYHDSFDLFVAEAYAAMRSRQVPDGLPIAADGVRSARLVDSVLASQLEGGAVTVSPVPS